MGHRPGCKICKKAWGTISSDRHHCRNCGDLFCNEHSSRKIIITRFRWNCSTAERVCDECYESLKKENQISPESELSASEFVASYITSSSPPVVVKEDEKEKVASAAHTKVTKKEKKKHHRHHHHHRRKKSKDHKAKESKGKEEEKVEKGGD